MNRFYNQFFNSLEKGKTVLYARITFGASGAPTVDGVNSKGVKSVARTGAGAYTVTLEDPYVRLMGLRHVCVSATAPAAPSMYVTAESVTTKTINVQFNAAGTSTDPASGEEVRLEIVLKASTAQ